MMVGAYVVGCKQRKWSELTPESCLPIKLEATTVVAHANTPTSIDERMFNLRNNNFKIVLQLNLEVLQRKEELLAIYFSSCCCRSSSSFGITAGSGAQTQNLFFF
jgi:hypothetical protein